MTVMIMMIIFILKKIRSLFSILNFSFFFLLSVSLFSSRTVVTGDCNDNDDDCYYYYDDFLTVFLLVGFSEKKENLSEKKQLKIKKLFFQLETFTFSFSSPFTWTAIFFYKKMIIMIMIIIINEKNPGKNFGKRTQKIFLNKNLKFFFLSKTRRHHHHHQFETKRKFF